MSVEEHQTLEKISYAAWVLRCLAESDQGERNEIVVQWLKGVEEIADRRLAGFPLN